MSDQIEDATDTEPMSEDAELGNDVLTSMKPIEEGHVVSNRDAEAELRKRLAR
jgi:hypothetical protein